MQHFRMEQPTQNRVMALFETSAAFFELPPVATLEDLAGRLARLSKRHGGALVSVDVRVGALEFSATEQPAKPADDSISPYLQRPLRTFEKAQQDRKRRLRQIAVAQANAPRRTGKA